MQKSSLRLFLILLVGFSYVLYVSAIPATRTKSLYGEDSTVMPSLAQQQGALKLEIGEEKLLDKMEERLMERRVDLEIVQDYGGTGANKDHDPKTPGNG